MHQYGDSYFWLSDLSGRVSATNDPKTKERASQSQSINVIELILKAIVPIFDALIFNGSLFQQSKQRSGRKEMEMCHSCHQ